MKKTVSVCMTAVMVLFLLAGGAGIRTFGRDGGAGFCRG